MARTELQGLFEAAKSCIQSSLMGNTEWTTSRRLFPESRLRSLFLWGKNQDPWSGYFVFLGNPDYSLPRGIELWEFSASRCFFPF